MAFDGVPNETRKALADGTTIFERVLPGPDRMYPDTDSAPIPIDEAVIEQIRSSLPRSIADCSSHMREWRIPVDCRTFILKRNLYPLLEKLVHDQGLNSTFAGTLLGHTLRHACGDRPGDVEWILELACEARKRKLKTDILKPLLQYAFADPRASFDELLNRIGYSPASESEVLATIPALLECFEPRKRRTSGHAVRDWVMGRLRPAALGNLSLTKLAESIEEGGA